MNKIDLPVESGHGDPFHLTDTTERHLVYEKKENGGIFVRFSVSDRGRWSGNERSATCLTTIAYRSCFCPSERLIVGFAFLYVYMVVRALLVWAGRGSYDIKRLPKSDQLFMDGFVTLYRWILTTKTAPKHRRASAWTNHGISIPPTFCCSSASGLCHRASRNTKILALRILTEIDLNPANLYRNTFIELTWSFEQRNPPYRILSDRGANVKKVSTR